jgi:NADPH-dependent F420 reductase
MDISIVGGTGDIGFGLALRLARAGHLVVIGSRSPERAAEAAERARGILGGEATVEGAVNDAAAGGNEVLFVTVPYEGQAEIYRSIKAAVPAGRIVVDCTSPLATAVGGRPWQVLRPWHGSAAEQAKAILGSGPRVVAGFHTVGAEPLSDLDSPLPGDVPLCGDDAEAKSVVGGLVEAIPDLRWVDAGALSMARVVEPLTALMISVNRRYRRHGTGLILAGANAWGAPPATGR